MSVELRGPVILPAGQERIRSYLNMVSDAILFCNKAVIYNRYGRVYRTSSNQDHMLIKSYDHMNEQNEHQRGILFIL